MDKYAGTPMIVADACVVCLSELQKQVLVLTVDSDFRIYRRFGRRVIPSLNLFFPFHPTRDF